MSGTGMTLIIPEIEVRRRRRVVGSTTHRHRLSSRSAGLLTPPGPD